MGPEYGHVKDPFTFCRSKTPTLKETQYDHKPCTHVVCGFLVSLCEHFASWSFCVSLQLFCVLGISLRIISISLQMFCISLGMHFTSLCIFLMSLCGCFVSLLLLGFFRPFGPLGLCPVGPFIHPWLYSYSSRPLNDILVLDHSSVVYSYITS